MPDTGSPFNLPYPVSADEADVPLDMEALAVQVAAVLASILDGDTPFTEVSFGDVTVYRSAPNVLKTDDNLQAIGHLLATQGTAGQVRLGGNTDTAAVYFGTAEDTNLYRSAADTLKTDDALIVTGSLTVGSNAVTGSIRGRVDANGTIAAGSGFTVNKTGTGQYVIAGLGFSTEPAFTFTPIGSLAAHRITTGTLSTAGCTVLFTTLAGGAQDISFSFTATPV